MVQVKKGRMKKVKSCGAEKASCITIAFPSSGPCRATFFRLHTFQAQGTSEIDSRLEIGGKKEKAGRHMGL